MSYYGNRQEWEGVDIIWTLEIEYFGQVFRFASFAMDLLDNDGKSYPYTSGLEDVVINSSIKKVGDYSGQEDSVSMSITFPNLNIAQNQIKGNFIEGSKALIGYVLIKNGQIQNSYDDRPIVFNGIITGPNYGFPNRDVGYIEFSIENKGFISSKSILSLIMGSNMYIESISCTNAFYVKPEWDYDKGLVEVNETHRGKVIPFVFGNLTSIQQSNGDTIGIPITPAYILAADPVTGNYYFLIAGHNTTSTTVKIYNDIGQIYSPVDVGSFVNIDNRTITYFILPDFVTFNTPLNNGNDPLEVWVEWDNGGTYPNPLGEGTLEGGGDICLWLLSQLTKDLDYEAWNGLRVFLNQYKFGGYINDDKISVFQWLQKNIVAYLPISIVNGPKGLKPVLDLFQIGADIRPRLIITTGTEFQRASAVISVNTPEDITNHVIVRYAFNGITKIYSTFVQASNEIPSSSQLASISYIAHPKSMLSIQRYGKKEKTIALDYCYDNNTAQRIAQDIISREALPIKTIQYSVSIKYGYLILGDIIQLTDEEIGLYGYYGQIISKVFDDNRWLIDIKIDDNPLRYNRNV